MGSLGAIACLISLPSLERLQVSHQQQAETFKGLLQALLLLGRKPDLFNLLEVYLWPERHYPVQVSLVRGQMRPQQARQAQPLVSLLERNLHLETLILQETSHQHKLQVGQTSN